jgi:aspartate kinase
MKFGGTSVGSPEAIIRSARLVAPHADAQEEVVVVVSALNGVTNLLLESVRHAAHLSPDQVESYAQAFYQRHAQLIQALSLSALEEQQLFSRLSNYQAQLQKILSILQSSPGQPEALQDAAASLGERTSAPIFAALLRQQGIPAISVDAGELILTDENFTRASVRPEPTYQKIRSKLSPILAQGIVPVVTGFIGATSDGRVTTLGRGASDYTSTILGAALNAVEVWNWTDVDGVLSADPRLVPEARTIPVLSYEEMSLLSAYGAKVLHPDTVRPISRSGIPLRVRNSFHPDGPGTIIQSENHHTSSQPFAIASFPGLTLLESSQEITNPGGFALQPLGSHFKNSFALSSIRENPELTEAHHYTSNVTLLTLIPGKDQSARILTALKKRHVTVLAWQERITDGSISLAVKDEEAADTARILFKLLSEKITPVQPQTQILVNACPVL